MKNILVKSIFVFLIFIWYIYNVNAIQVISSSSKTNSCDWAKVNDIIYIEDNNKMQYLYDEFWTRDDRLISDNKTEVTIWQSDNDLLEWCENSNSWKRVSSLSPGSNQHVIAMGANCTFKKPTNRTKRTLQFVYNVWYYDIFENEWALIWDWDLEYYTSINDLRDKEYKTKHYEDSWFKDFNLHNNECYNVELRYCWDGIISDWEECDPYAPGFNEQSCSISTCTSKDVIIPKVEVDKTDANPNDLDNNERDSQLIYKWDEAVFKITVTNNRNNKEALKDIILTDIKLSSCNRTISQTKELIEKVWNKDDKLDLGESFSYVCQWEYKDNQVHWINEIKVVATWVTSWQNDDDTDPTEVLVQGAPDSICTWLTVSPDHWDVSFSSTLTCTGTDTEAFKIEIKDDLWNLVYTINSNNWSYTFTNAWNYIAACYVNDRNTTEDVCIKSISTTNIWWWEDSLWRDWWEGGGSSPACFNIENTSTNEFTCTVNKNTYDNWTVWIDCDRDWVYEQVATEWNGLDRDSNGRYVARFTCSSTDSDWNEVTVNPVCAVQRWTVWANQSDWYYTVNQCKYIANNICWDWVVQNPNSDRVKEECDLGSNNGINSSCSSSCKLHIKNPSCSTDNDYYEAHKNDICKFITRPSAWELEITSVSNFAIGNNQKVFKKQDSYYEFNTDNINNKALFIKNTWDEPMYFNDQLCLFDRWDKEKIEYTDSNYNGENQNIISWDNIYCEQNSIGFLYPGETKYLKVDDLEDIKWNTDNFSEKMKTSHLVLTVQNWWATYDWSPILAGQIYVTVAKPTIVSQWGWTTYLSDNNISNVNKIAETVVSYNDWIDATVNTNQNNFVATVLGSESKLSNINTIDNAELLEEAKKESTDLEEEVISIVEESTNTRNSWDINSFDSYNWIDNVYFVKDANITMPATSFSERKTYIIENGDLIIEWNIESTKNIAFIVKNGDIIIKDNVTQIDGTYVNIWGKIKSDNTSNELIVNGSLYGDLSELTENRTHISMDDEGNINVWTIISFGSNILNKPAPLVGQFIGEYMNSKKIAQ